MKPQVGLLVLLLSLVLSVVGCGDPADAHRYNSSGVKLFEQGRPEEALAEYNEAITSNLTDRRDENRRERFNEWAGQSGDGKVWVTTIDEIVRVRTGERGDDAL